MIFYPFRKFHVNLCIYCFAFCSLFLILLFLSNTRKKIHLRISHECNQLFGHQENENMPNCRSWTKKMNWLYMKKLNFKNNTPHDLNWKHDTFLKYRTNQQLKHNHNQETNSKESKDPPIVLFHSSHCCKIFKLPKAWT